ncbi:hypothetical protein D3C72_1423990 [compost metagenome]
MIHQVPAELPAPAGQPRCQQKHRVLDGVGRCHEDAGANLDRAMRGAAVVLPDLEHEAVDPAALGIRPQPRRHRPRQQVDVVVRQR